MCTNCIEQGTDNGGFTFGSGQPVRFHQIIEKPCLVCKKTCGVTPDPYTIVPSGSQFSGNYICGDCFQGHLDPALQSVLDNENDLMIAEKSHLEYLDGSGRSLEMFLDEDKEGDL